MGMKKSPTNWKELETALITGGSSGLGAEYARKLAEKGMNIILTARREEKMNLLAQELENKFKVKVEVITADLAQEADIEKVKRFIEQREDIDVLFNNAGYGIPGNFKDMDLQRAVNNLKVHNLAPIILTHAIISKMMDKNKGILLYTSSLSSFLPARGGMYSATKAFLTMFARSLEFDLMKSNVRIQALCPGFFHSEFHDKDYKDFKKNSIKGLWMDVNEIVEESLQGLEKDKVVVIPGFKYKLARWLMTSKIIGRTFVRMLNKPEKKR